MEHSAGWKCPNCDRVISPYVTDCKFCNDSERKVTIKKADNGWILEDSCGGEVNSEVFPDSWGELEEVEAQVNLLHAVKDALGFTHNKYGEYAIYITVFHGYKACNTKYEECPLCYSKLEKEKE